MFCDRYVEFLNRVQDERRGKFAAFEQVFDVADILYVLHYLPYYLLFTTYLTTCYPLLTLP